MKSTVVWALVILTIAATSAHAEADAPQLIAHLKSGFCGCPVWQEGRSCDVFEVHWPCNLTMYWVEVFLNGVERVEEVRFGLLLSDDLSHLTDLICLDDFLTTITDTVAGPELEVTATAFDDCHTITDGVHFLVCLAIEVPDDVSGTISLVPDPRTGEASVTTCDGADIAIPPGYLGRVGIGDGQGYNPCKEGSVPTRESSWTRIKALHSRDQR